MTETGVLQHRLEEELLPTWIERAEQIGGRLQLISQPGQGTRIFVEVPYHE